MKPKEKAKELLDKMQLDWACDSCHNDWAKECALIAVSEIIKSKTINYLFTENELNSLEETSDDRWIFERFNKYWLSVKKEIRNL